jgi:hypothetical protein
VCTANGQSYTCCGEPGYESNINCCDPTNVQLPQCTRNRMCYQTGCCGGYKIDPLTGKCTKNLQPTPNAAVQPEKKCKVHPTPTPTLHNKCLKKDPDNDGVWSP